MQNGSVERVQKLFVLSCFEVPENYANGSVERVQGSLVSIVFPMYLEQCKTVPWR